MILRKPMKGALAGLAAFSLLAVACSDDGETASEEESESTGEEGGSQATSETLAAVRDRGELVCGVNDVVPGFGLVNEEGEYEGFDIEFCKVIAAAVLGDAEAVEYRPLTADERFTALQAGEIDVLVRNTTWTATRDGSEGATFVTTTFYDGQGMMVHADSGIESIDDMDGTSICVLTGTTTQLNLETRFQGMDYEPQPYDDNDQIQPVFEQGACDGWTSDLSQLVGIRSTWPEDQGGPDALVIFDEAFSKEPLGPVVRDGDQQWADVVNWAVIATMQAEEFGITADNLDEMRDSDNPDILRFLGEPVAEEEGAEAAPFDPGLGLDADYAVNVIEQVGNYEEIYNRTIGPDTPLGLERGLNSLWTDGGILYPPPYR